MNGRGTGTLVALALAMSAGVAWANHDPARPDTSLARFDAQANISYRARVADGNLVGVTITNYGFIGNNFISRSPSLEYPLGAGYEHLVRGGLWVGADSAQDNTSKFRAVSTAALDGRQGEAAQGATEYTPLGDEIQVRSKLSTSESYSPVAVSELDLISEYTDRPAKRGANNTEAPRPLGIVVHQENYAWSFSDYEHVNFFHFRIKNDGPPMEKVWVGIYSEFASGNKTAATSWPPPGSWYNKKLIEYDGDTLRLFREHYCASANQVPDNCQFEVAPYWIGLKLLGWKRSSADTDTVKTPTLSAWGWTPGSPFRDEDTERYKLMSTGVEQPLVGDSLQVQSGDPVELLAIGPFSQIDPQDTIVVDFALVGGKDVESIRRHAVAAQRAFDRDYIVPEPPESPKLRVIARHNALDLYWNRKPEDQPDPATRIKDFEGYRVYIGEDRLDLHRIGEFDLAAPPHDTLGFNTGFSAIQHDTILVDALGRKDTLQYRYTINNLRDGFKYFVAVTSFDLGNDEIESLESGIQQNKTLAIPAPDRNDRVRGNEVTVFPNPYRVEARWDVGQRVRDHYLWFANMPQQARIKIFTLSGDLVFESEFDGGTYHGGDTRGIYDPRRELDVDPPTLSGRTFGWNMITREGQAAATGLYVFVVEDRATGDRQRGKFLIIKSDREDF